jgi:hypothetical protein
MSQLIKSFLDPQSIEFSSSIFNDIQNLGKIVKGVPLKLRVERGQSLDTFLQNLLNSVKHAKPKANTSHLNSEDHLEKQLANKIFVNTDRSKKVIKKLIASGSLTESDETSSRELTRPFQSLMVLSKTLLKLNKI